MFESYVEELGDVLVIHLIGDLSVKTIGDADEILFSHLSAGFAVIAVDCGELDHVDSYAINHLFKFAKAAAEKDIPLVMVAVNPVVLKLLELTKLNKLYRVMPKADFRREFLSTYEPPVN